MADAPGIFTTGTASVVAGGMTVTFQGAQNLAASVRSGDRFGGHVGFAVRIQSVTASTVTLAHPWPGPAQTTAPYEIVFSPYDLGYREDIQKIIQRYGRGALPAMAELAVAADTLPYGTGPDTLALAGFSSFGRSLVASADKNTAYAVLGEVPGAQLPPRLGTSGAAIPSGNYDLALESGFYLGPGASAVNGPPGAAIYGSLIVSRRTTSSAITQIALIYTPSIGLEYYLRGSGDGGSTWSTWRSLVAQSGSNANGDYVRFPDGTQICALVSRNTGGQSTPSGSMFASSLLGPFSYPAAFTSILGGYGSSSSENIWFGILPAGTLVYVKAFAATSLATSFAYRVVVIGRWY